MISRSLFLSLPSLVLLACLLFFSFGSSEKRTSKKNKLFWVLSLSEAAIRLFSPFSFTFKLFNAYTLFALETISLFFSFFHSLHHTHSALITLVAPLHHPSNTQSHSLSSLVSSKQHLLSLFLSIGTHSHLHSHSHSHSHADAHFGNTKSPSHNHSLIALPPSIHLPTSHIAQGSQWPTTNDSGSQRPVIHADERKSSAMLSIHCAPTARHLTMNAHTTIPPRNEDHPKDISRQLRLGSIGWKDYSADWSRTRTLVPKLSEQSWMPWPVRRR